MAPFIFRSSSILHNYTDSTMIGLQMMCMQTALTRKLTLRLQFLTVRLLKVIRVKIIGSVNPEPMNLLPRAA
ncbi:hypothetical protein MALU111345_22420 [Marinicrinis lubricantis]